MVKVAAAYPEAIAAAGNDLYFASPYNNTAPPSSAKKLWIKKLNSNPSPWRYVSGIIDVHHHC
jgi:hypothetical protein